MIIPNNKVDFYRWNPASRMILIIITESKVIVWYLFQNKYYLVSFQTEPLEELGTEIIDAEWDYTGEYFTVTFDNRTTVVFDQENDILQICILPITLLRISIYFIK